MEVEQIGGAGGTSFPHNTENYIDYYPIFGSRERIWIKPGVGGHGGGDPLIQEDVFMGVIEDRPYDILADSKDGLCAISIGDAVFKSIESGEVIDLTDVMKN